MPYQVQRNKEYWTETLSNDFENYAFVKYPVLKEIMRYIKTVFLASALAASSLPAQTVGYELKLNELKYDYGVAAPVASAFSNSGCAAFKLLSFTSAKAFM